jgi:hypothetical protein
MRSTDVQHKSIIEKQGRLLKGSKTDFTVINACPEKRILFA